MENSNHKDLSFYWISLCVLLCHLGLLVWAVLFSNSFLIMKPNDRLVVKTVTLNPSSSKSPSQAQVKSVEEKKITPQSERQNETKIESKKEVKIESKKEPKKVDKVESKKEAKIEPKKELKKNEQSKPLEKVKPVKSNNTPIKDTKPKTTSVQKTQATPTQKKTIEKSVKEVKKESQSKGNETQLDAVKIKQQELFAKAQESISKIGKNHDKIATNKKPSAALSDIPSKLDKMNVETLSADDQSSLTSQEIGYKEELASLLKLFLTLPEYGEVKIKLTLLRSGKFSHVAIVSGSSLKNRNYIEKELPKLSFSGFGNNFGNVTENIFLISLINE